MLEARPSSWENMRERSGVVSIVRVSSTGDVSALPVKTRPTLQDGEQERERSHYDLVCAEPGDDWVLLGCLVELVVVRHDVEVKQPNTGLGWRRGPGHRRRRFLLTLADVQCMRNERDDLRRGAEDLRTKRVDHLEHEL